MKKKIIIIDNSNLAYSGEEINGVDSFPKGELEVGKSFQAKDQAGNDVSFKVIKMDDDEGEVTIRFNHPLAGKDISFKVEILEVAEEE